MRFSSPKPRSSAAPPFAWSAGVDGGPRVGSVMTFPVYYSEGIFRIFNHEISVPQRAVAEAAEAGTNDEESKCPAR